MKPEPPVTKVAPAISRRSARRRRAARRVRIRSCAESSCGRGYSPSPAPARGPPGRRPSRPPPVPGRGRGSRSGSASPSPGAGRVAAAHSASSSASSSRLSPSSARARRVDAPGLGLAAGAHRVAVEAVGQLDRLQRRSVLAGRDLHVGEGVQAELREKTSPSCSVSSQLLQRQRQRRLGVAAVGDDEALRPPDPALGLRVVLLGGDAEPLFEQRLRLLGAVSLAQRHRLRHPPPGGRAADHDPGADGGIAMRSSRAARRPSVRVRRGRRRTCRRRRWRRAPRRAAPVPRSRRPGRSPPRRRRPIRRSDRQIPGRAAVSSFSRASERRSPIRVAISFASCGQRVRLRRGPSRGARRSRAAAGARARRAPSSPPSRPARRPARHLLPEPQRVLGPGVSRPVGGARGPASRLQGLVAGLQVVGDQRRQLVVAVGRLDLDHRPRRRGVGGGAAIGELGVVGDLAGQGVAEGEDPLRVHLGFVEEAGLGQLAEGRLHLLGVEARGQPQRRGCRSPCRPPRRPGAAAWHRGRGGRCGRRGSPGP